MPLPALAIPAAAKIGAYAIGGGMLATGWAKDIIGAVQAGKLNAKQLDLQRLMLQGELDAGKAANDENRRQAEMYLAMFGQEKAEARKDKQRQRELDMLAVMLGAMNQVRTAQLDSVRASRMPAPPMALSTLLRGE
jgi:monomeric isocitrate dehydrogenase